MHQYMKAIGFTEINSRENERELINSILENEIMLTHKPGYVECNQPFGRQFGVLIYGELFKDGKFDKEYYMPYYKSKKVSSYADIIV